jgi:hypothetical protein
MAPRPFTATDREKEFAVSPNPVPEVFAERVVGVAHANGVFRITLAQQDESDQPRPVVRLMIPEVQAQAVLQGIAAGMSEIRSKLTQAESDQGAGAPAPKMPSKKPRKSRAKSKSG